MLDEFLSKILIIIGYVGCDWFWLDLIQAVSLTAKLQKTDLMVGFLLWGSVISSSRRGGVRTLAGFEQSSLLR